MSCSVTVYKNTSVCIGVRELVLILMLSATCVQLMIEATREGTRIDTSKSIQNRLGYRGGGGHGAKAPGLSKWRPRTPKRRRDRGFAGSGGVLV